MNAVVVRGARIPLLARNALGAGGEATVTLHVSGRERLAIKVFRAPTPEKVRKIERLLALASALPSAVVTPIAPAYDESGASVVGYAMPALASTFEPLAQLSSRSFRAARAIGKREVARVLLALARGLGAVHAAGAIVGDLNDQNELFVRDEVRLIDADSFQLGELACEVSTEAFLDPLLYGPDPRAPCITAGSTRRFTMASDWYAFAVLAFRALTGVHPFGGVVAALPALPLRAAAGKSALAPDVALPLPAKEGIALLTRDLTGWFRAVFDDRHRSAFPLQLIESYEREIVRCGCGLDLPASLLPCPRCAPARVSFVDRTRGIDAEELLSARGTILGVSTRGESIFVVARDETGLTLHQIDSKNKRSARIEGVPKRGGYDVIMSEAFALVFPADATDGVRIDLVSRTVEEIVVERSRRRPGIALQGASTLRIAKGWILSADRRGGEAPIATVIESQARMVGSPTSEFVLVSERFFGVHRYRVLAARMCEDLEVPPLDDAESLLEEELAVSKTTVAILRRTARHGRVFVRSSLFHVTASQGRLSRELVAHVVADVSSRASGEVIAHGLLVGERYLVATDRGLVREDLASGASALELPATAPYAREGSLLAFSPRGLLVATGNRLFALKIASS